MLKIHLFKFTININAAIFYKILILKYHLNMLKKIYRLKNKRSFNATYKTGNVKFSGGITVFCGKNKTYGNTKIGFVVSKKIHKRAVRRNRIKRLMRESVRLYIKKQNDNFDTNYLSLVFVASTKLLDKDFKYIDKNIIELMEKIKK